ncbi:MAG: hypothetical protein N4A71_25100 [Carboxylicivirga sp.]|jgi:uncharacterized FlaG/YvyC family protein|nr:hypothetical protein [Carboxylicivirga sp.]
MRINELIGDVELINKEILTCSNHSDLKLIVDKMETFKNKFRAKAKFDIDRELIDTYYSFFEELMDYQRTKINFNQNLSKK